MAGDTKPLFHATKDEWENSDSESDDFAKPGSRKSKLRKTPFALLLFAFFSCALNLFQTLYIVLPGFQEGSHCAQSSWKVASEGIDVPITRPTGVLDNLTLTDAEWEAIDTSKGFVALDKGLPHMIPSEPFPWDASKEVYLLRGFHDIHCLRIIYISFRQFQRNETLTYNFGHTLHCLNALREDVKCAADDTPYFLGDLGLDENVRIQAGQTRRCRDWKKLEDFAVENSACFESANPGEPGYHTIEEWGHCPANSPYRPAMEEYFNNLSDSH